MTTDKTHTSGEPQEWHVTADSIDLPTLARLAAEQGYAIVRENGTGESWSAGKRVFAKWARQWADAKTSDMMFAIEDVAVLEIEQAMISAGRVK